MLSKRLATKFARRFKECLPLLAGLLILFLTYLFGNEIGAFVGFPKGYDGYGHMGLTRIVRDSWPHLYWNPYWDSGSTLLIRSYPPMTYLLGGLMSKVFSWPLEKVFTFFTTISFFFIILGVYCFVFSLTKKIIPALLASLFLISSPALWSCVIEGGLYPRLFGTAPLVLSWLFVWLYLKQGKQSEGSLWHILAIFSLFLSITFHQLSAVWAFLVVVSLVGLWVETKIEILKKVISLFVPVGLLAAFYYLPLIFVLGGNPPSWGRFPGQPAYTPVSLARLFKPETTMAAVPVLLIPLAFLTVFLRFGQKIKEENQKKAVGVSKVMAVFAAISLFYALGLFGGYFHGVYPHHFLFYFVLFLATFVGLGFGLVQKVAPVERILLLAFCGVIIVSWQKQVPELKQRVIDYSRFHQGIFQSIEVDEGEKNYRFGNADEVVAGWFNFKNLSPQTRDYYPFNPLYPGWQYFLEDAVWQEKENYQQTNFLLDWYGIKNFYAGQPRRGIQKVIGGKFTNRPEYQAIENKNNQFVFKEATPILSATNTSVVAVVADQSSYDLLVRDLALGNLNSQVLIPLKIGERVSDLNREDLSRFDGVILYGFKGGIGGRTALRLTEYLKEGGWLLIEKSKEGLRGELPDPWPLKRSFPATTGGDWQWEGNESGGKVDFGEGNWGVEVAVDVKNWAQPLVFFQDQPVVVSGQLGKGKVIWSGLNLPYHLSVSEDPEELKFLQDNLLSLLKEEEGKTIDFAAHFIHNQRREIEVKEKAKGILFKESYFPNWKAYIQTTNDQRPTTKRLKIYPAGPMMMYVSLPEGELPAKVVLFYQVSFLEKLGWFVSLTTLIVMIGLGIKKSGLVPSFQFPRIKIGFKDNKIGKILVNQR